MKRFYHLVPTYEEDHTLALPWEKGFYCITTGKKQKREDRLNKRERMALTDRIPMGLSGEKKTLLCFHGCHGNTVASVQ